MYAIKYHKKVIKQLKKLPNHERQKVVQSIHRLNNEREAKALDIKRFTKTEKSFRLRIGKIRIIYQMDTAAKTIFVKRVGYRGDVYKH